MADFNLNGVTDFNFELSPIKGGGGGKLYRNEITYSYYDSDTSDGLDFTCIAYSSNENQYEDLNGFLDAVDVFGTHNVSGYSSGNDAQIISIKKSSGNYKYAFISSGISESNLPISTSSETETLTYKCVTKEA
ncbi:MAG: hypothetical protein KBS62_03480 [Oscillospiraceae bacterium]|nr:hypothetical protein [Candidatus Ruminococcus equi]